MEVDQQPRTLAEAHEVLWQQRPGRDADPLVWVAFHRSSAEVYARTAKFDGAHRQEAAQCAVMEIRRAREIEHRLDPSVDEEA
ncbi:AMED_5909 family protein [Actinophytocola sp. KF-1]